jgi:hypothetical protein
MYNAAALRPEPNVKRGPNSRRATRAGTPALPLIRFQVLGPPFCVKPSAAPMCDGLRAEPSKNRALGWNRRRDVRSYVRYDCDPRPRRSRVPARYMLEPLAGQMHVPALSVATFCVCGNFKSKTRRVSAIELPCVLYRDLWAGFFNHVFRVGVSGSGIPFRMRRSTTNE